MKRLAATTAIVLATLVGVALAWFWRGVVLIFFASLGVSAALRPIVQRLVDRGWRRRRALGCAYAVAIVAVIIFLLAILDPLAGDIQALAADVPVAYERIVKTWPHGDENEQSFARNLPTPERMDELASALFGAPTRRVLMGATVGVFSILVDLTLIVVLSLYWSFDRVHFERLWLSLMEVDSRTRAREIWREVEVEFGAYLRSEVVQALAVGLLLNFGYRLMGHPYPVLLPTICALAWMIPWIGGPIGVLAAALLSLPPIVAGDATVWTLALPAAAYTLAVLTFAEFWVEPRLFDRGRFNSLLVVLMAIGLADLFGVLGLLLAPPLAAAVQLIGEHLLGQRAATAVPAAAEAPDARTIRQRVDDLRAELAERGETRPQVLSLVDRLDEVVARAEEIDGSAPPGDDIPEGRSSPASAAAGARTEPTAK